MKVDNIFNLADELVFSKTGKHLDDLQRIILEGTLQGKKYAQIATENQYSDNYIKESASELWQILSEVMGEGIKKSNFRTTFERVQFHNGSHLFSNDLIRIGDVNFCSNTQNKNLQKACLWTNNIPSLNNFCGRTEELKILENWIKENRLIVVAGLVGIGKTYLSLKLIEQVQNQFDFVIYRNLSDFATLKDLQYDLLESLNATQTKKDLRVALLEYLRTHSGLIILDDGQSLFRSQRLAGEYQPQHKEYCTFFELIGKTHHKSCVIFNTWDIPREVIKLTADHHPVKLLNLTGMNETAREILKEQGLSDNEQWLNLIALYQGNPLWLKLAATLIKDVFSGRVSQYLEGHLVLPEDLKALLTMQFERLTETEKITLIWLSEEDNPLTITQILNKGSISRSELSNTLQSLLRRFLVEKQEDGETYFTISPIIKEYCLIV